ncbi:tripartite tricarboxylate transporter substrate binding protein [Frigidibacter albus]|uniref:Tripartite tricarboxylate transporter substrate binding protein n=1 Tax=Frigidibacter albus TaxID=1465486 RepID=A0A6L8VLE6_9RHOB|nr:tripartite tricarboxylate transporter substrate binding protein [Frigidibacter albus]MZQ90546.1 tripartite tricarboxylate transporter substrate binding protein [Frigidibacter albus]NBE32334.1 tripartite tricarboxylate transporter substrate binding protein [Frigidibacter albus]GGH59226.1 ABC transporter substrate-binding protein [Frigidibacter albus]
MLKSVIGAVVALGLGALPVLADYPEKEIQGIIQWGAGGSTDTVARAITPHAEAALGGNIVMQNVTGGVGAIGLNQVADAEADGYSILFGAENPLLYKVMKLGDKDYSDFVAINIIARGVPILVANVDAPFDTFPEMVEYVNANPRAVKFGSTGPGGLPSVVTAMINSKTPLDVTFVPYDGDGPALTALQGGAIDVMPAVLGAAIEGIKGGTMKPLALFDIEASPQLPDVPTIVSTNPEFEEMLPWGPFFGVFVKQGTPDDVVTKLTAAYAEAAKNPDFEALIDGRGFKMLSLSGAEADTFLSEWQATTSWLIHDAGLTKASPEEFGIAKP